MQLSFGILSLLLGSAAGALRSKHPSILSLLLGSAAGALRSKHPSNPCSGVQCGTLNCNFPFYPSKKHADGDTSLCCPVCKKQPGVPIHAYLPSNIPESMKIKKCPGAGMACTGIDSCPPPMLCDASAAKCAAGSCCPFCDGDGEKPVYSPR